jgi:hypothetical protein
LTTTIRGSYIKSITLALTDLIVGDGGLDG